MLHSFLHLLEGYMGDGRISDHEDQIDARHDMIKAEPHCLTHPTPRAVALDGIAEVLASDDAAARLAAAVRCCRQAQQAMLIRSSFAAHPLKLPGAAQPMGPLHDVRVATAHHLTHRKDRYTHSYRCRVHLPFRGASKRRRSVNTSAPFVA
jgi:hypothetical protein